MTHESEEEAYAYAYNDGHSGSRKNEPYKPNPNTKEGANFKKIYKQRAESADKKFCSNCSQEEEEFIEISNCTDCYDDFCEECFCSDCETCNDDCLCKCVDCGNKDHYMFDLAEGGNACMDCSSRCDDCEKRFLRDEVRGNNINHKDYCEDCRNEKGNCVICDDLLIDYYNNAGHCEVCDESVCGECSSETEDPEKPGYVGHDVACDECVKEKKLVVTAESSDSYDNLAHQDEMAQEAYQEYVQELDPATDYPPMSFEDWYEQTMAIYDTPEYDKYLEQQYLQMQEDEEELARQLMTLEADWRDLSRDSSGRWMKENEISDENLDAYIDIQPGQSGTFPLPVEKEEPSLKTTNDYITIRDLASMMNKMTGGMLGFAESRNTVLEMLGDNDSMERRDSLYFTIEDTIMTMENYNETGYEGDIQVMVDIMRDTGIAPPANFEEKVMARYQFEDKYAAEDKKILKPEVPADYNIQQTFGNNMVLMAEDSGMTDLQIVNLIESPFWEAWTTSTSLGHSVNPGWWNLTISVRDLKMWTRGIKANRNWKVSDVKSYFNIRGNKDSLVTQIEAIQRLINNLQEGDAGSVARVNDIIEVWFHHVPKEAESETFDAEEDEGPTIDNFFRELSKLLKKYGSIETFDSERVKEGLYFSGMILPHNGAYNFFQYDEDFGSGIIE